MASGEAGEATAMAMRIVAETGRILGATRLLPIDSAHIDGCLYHGDSGVLFAERLVEQGGRTIVPATLNVGGLDLLHPNLVRTGAHERAMARRLMAAYEALGCQASWTCAPYQHGHRPGLGRHVAWGESNAVVFANSVLGARTNRYGDFMDIACALVGRAPDCGLHTDAARAATLLVDTSGIPDRVKARDAFYPVLGAWLGATVGDAVAAIDGLGAPTEDQLKALGAAAASSGSVGLFHVIGRTPEATSRDTAFQGRAPREVLVFDRAAMLATRDRLSTGSGGQVDAIAVGSPHFSEAEFTELERLLAGRRLALPFYACTARAVQSRLEQDGMLARLESQGITFVVDTCVVVARILPAETGILMTNSGKFAHYALPNTGHGSLFATLEDCVETAVAGRATYDPTAWS